MSICGHRAPAFALAIVFAALPLLAQTQDEKIQQLQKLEQKLKDFQEQIDALAAQARVLQEEINAAKAKQQVAPSKSAEVQPVEPATTPEQSIAPSSTEAPTAAPITIVSGAGGKNFLNLSLDGLLAVGTSTTPNVGALEIGGHDPAQRGFTVQNVETVFEGAVDPYFRGQANVVLQITPDGGTQVELEEVYATTTSLPKGLQVKAGQFFTEFGRLNPQHPHSWDFVDQPLVNGRFFGPDGLRSAGVRVSWLTPTSFYSEVSVSLQNSQGETASSFRSVPGETLFGRTIEERAVSSISDMLIVPRYNASFDLSDTQTLLVGGSAALGPNGTGEGARTRIYGLDGFYKWKP
ncbi:MAG: PspA/IM30 family protein, partial [Thermoanaerobaculia bacterium]